MSVNVIEQVLWAALVAAGLRTADELGEDRWQSGAAWRALIESVDEEGCAHPDADIARVRCKRRCCRRCGGWTHFEICYCVTSGMRCGAASSNT